MLRDERWRIGNRPSSIRNGDPNAAVNAGIKSGTIPNIMMQTTNAAGNGNYIIQIQGDGNSVVTGLPHLALTRRRGIASHIATDPATGKPRESDVIRPFTRSIDMVGREKELADLRVWLNKETPISVRVLTGNAGHGKTRLALELIEEVVPQGWRAGFLTRAELKRFREQRDLAGWGWNSPTLAVVDHASGSARDLHAWLKELENSHVWDNAEAPNRRPLRLLLLERQAARGSGWWAAVFGFGDAAAVMEKLADPNEPVALRPLDDAKQRRAILTKTLARLGSTVTLPAPGDDADFDRRLAELTWAGVPLLLLLAGVTVAREGLGHVLAMAPQDLVLNVARTELERILRVVESQSVSQSLAPLVKHVAAVVTLRQGLTAEATREMIEQECGELGYNLPNGSAALRDAFAMALPSDAGGIAAIEPDMVGEALLLDVWKEDNVQALPAIARAYAADPDAVAKTVVRTCQDYVIRGHRHPLNWLEKIRADSTDLYALIHLSNAMPTSTVELREIATELDKAVVAKVYPPVGTLIDLNQFTIIADSLYNLSHRFSALGQRDDALDTMEEAVSLYRELSRMHPDSGRPKLAISLGDLSTCFSGLGQRGKAIAASKEAVVISRELVAVRPEAFHPTLATCLNTRSVCLHDFGRQEEALNAIEEAVVIRRDLVTVDADTFRPELARSLLNLSTYLSSLGRREEALAASEEAAAIGRDLAVVNPDAFRPNLVVYLNNLSNHLSKFGRHDQALAVIKDAVALGRDLTATSPDAFRPDLARSLANLSNRFFELGRRDEGLAAIEEAVALYRDLTTIHPDTFHPDLAKSLNNLSRLFLDLGRQEEAFESIEEAVATLRELFLVQPMAFEQLMDLLISNYLELCKDTGREESYPALWTPILEALQLLKDQSI